MVWLVVAVLPQSSVAVQVLVTVPVQLFPVLESIKATCALPQSSVAVVVPSKTSARQETEVFGGMLPKVGGVESV